MKFSHYHFWKSLWHILLVVVSDYVSLVAYFSFFSFFQFCLIILLTIFFIVIISNSQNCLICNVRCIEHIISLLWRYNLTLERTFQLHLQHNWQLATPWIWVLWCIFCATLHMIACLLGFLFYLNSIFDLHHINVYCTWITNCVEILVGLCNEISLCLININPFAWQMFNK